MADWPLWPEANGAIPIGGADGDDLHLLRHHGRWSLGWALHEWGVTEADTTTASWIHGWLAGEHSLTGEAADPRPSGVAISFDPRPTAIHLAELSPSTEPFEVRAELLAHTGAVRRDFVASLEPPPLAPISVVRYASAGWQRLDLSVADTSPSGSAAGWYDDAVDGSGRHRVGILVPPRQPQAASAIDRVAALLGSRVLDVQVL